MNDAAGQVLAARRTGPCRSLVNEGWPNGRSVTPHQIRTSPTVLHRVVRRLTRSVRSGSRVRGSAGPTLSGGLRPEQLDGHLEPDGGACRRAMGSERVGDGAHE